MTVLWSEKKCVLRNYQYPETSHFKTEITGRSDFYDGEDSSDEEGATSTHDIWPDDDLYQVALMLPSGENEYLNISENTEERDRFVEDLEGVPIGMSSAGEEVGEDLALLTTDPNLVLSEFSDESEHQQAFREAIRSTMEEEYEMDDDAGEWYDDPYGDDFIHDFSLIEDVWSPEKGWFRWAMIEDWSQEDENDWQELLKKKAIFAQSPARSEEQMTDEEYCLHFNIIDTLELVRTVGRAKEGVQILYDLLKDSDVDLNLYLAELDYCLVRYIIWGLNFHYNHDSDNFAETWQDPSEVLPSFEYRLLNTTTKMFQSFHSVGEINVKYWSMILNWFVKKLFVSKWPSVKAQKNLSPERQSFFGPNQQPIDQC